MEGHAPSWPLGKMQPSSREVALIVLLIFFSNLMFNEKHNGRDGARPSNASAKINCVAPVFVVVRLTIFI